MELSVHLSRQALELKPLSSLLPPEWNPLAKKPLRDGLLPSPEHEDEWEERVHACGNVVVPSQAAAALQFVSRLPALQ